MNLESGRPVDIFASLRRTANEVIVVALSGIIFTYDESGRDTDVEDALRGRAGIIPIEEVVAPLVQQ